MVVGDGGGSKAVASPPLLSPLCSARIKRAGWVELEPCEPRNKLALCPPKSKEDYGAPSQVG